VPSVPQAAVWHSYISDIPSTRERSSAAHADDHRLLAFLALDVHFRHFRLRRARKRNHLACFIALEVQRGLALGITAAGQEFPAPTGLYRHLFAAILALDVGQCGSRGRLEIELHLKLAVQLHNRVKSSVRLAPESTERPDLAVFGQRLYFGTAEHTPGHGFPDHKIAIVVPHSKLLNRS